MTTQRDSQVGTPAHFGARACALALALAAGPFAGAQAGADVPPGGTAGGAELELPAAPADRWPGFRGVGTGHTRARRLPTRWSAQEGLAWSVELPGTGQSSPVVWGGRVFVTSVAGPREERCRVGAYALEDGRELWSRAFPAGIELEESGTVSAAAPTPAADAERLVCFFESGALLALDHEGRLLWLRDLAAEHGAFEGNHGVASSPLLVGDAVLLLVDHAGPSFLVCVDAATGATRWRREREPRVSWSTPVLARPVRPGASPELVVSSSGVLQGYELAAGELRWSLAVAGNTVQSPTVVGERVLVGSSQRSDVLLARRGGPEGGAEVLWRPERARELGFASPLVHDGRVLLVGKAGAVSCLALETGELLWEERTADSCWASPIAAGELVYLFGKGGATTVLRPSDEGPNVVAENLLPTDSRVYGVAAVEGAFLVREGERLFCLRAAAAAPPSAGEPPERSGG